MEQHIKNKPIPKERKKEIKQRKKVAYKLIQNFFSINKFPNLEHTSKGPGNISADFVKKARTAQRIKKTSIEKITTKSFFLLASMLFFIILFCC